MKKRVLSAAVAAFLSFSVLPAVASEGDGSGKRMFQLTIEELTCRDGAWLSFLCFDSDDALVPASEGDGSGRRSEGDGSGRRSEGDGSGRRSEGDGSGRQSEGDGSGR